MYYTIYSMPNCKWCKMAKQLAQEKGVTYVYEEATDTKRAGLVLDVLGFKGEDRTMPKIYKVEEATTPGAWNDVFTLIGGYQEFKEHLS